MVWVFLSVSLVLATLYITGVIKPPVLAKGIASAAFVALGVFAFASGGNADPDVYAFRWLIVTGLVLGALGDVLLELGNKKQLLFLLGVASFFLGHAAYIAAGITVGDPHVALLALVATLPIAAVLTSLSVCLLTLSGAMRFALMGYVFTLSYMTTFAWFKFFTFSASPYYLIAPGATLFLISDVVLGIRMFGKRSDPKFGGQSLERRNRILGAICLVTYYLAQNAIALSLILS